MNVPGSENNRSATPEQGKNRQYRAYRMLWMQAGFEGITPGKELFTDLAEAQGICERVNRKWGSSGIYQWIQEVVAVKGKAVKIVCEIGAPIARPARKTEPAEQVVLLG